MACCAFPGITTRHCSYQRLLHLPTYISCHYHHPGYLHHTLLFMTACCLYRRYFAGYCARIPPLFTQLPAHLASPTLTLPLLAATFPTASPPHRARCGVFMALAAAYWRAAAANSCCYGYCSACRAYAFAFAFSTTPHCVLRAFPLSSLPWRLPNLRYARQPLWLPRRAA